MNIDVEVLDCLVYDDSIVEDIKNLVKIQEQNPDKIVVLNYCDDSLSCPRYVIYVEKKFFNDLYIHNINLRGIIESSHKGVLTNMYPFNDERKITNPEDILTEKEYQEYLKNKQEYE